MVDAKAAERFLALPRLAVVGASDDKRKFGFTVYRALKAHGHDVVPVNPHAATVDGDPCYPDLGSMPEPVDGVVVMVNRDRALDVVQSCAAHGIGHVWLFKGLGGPGAMSDGSVDYCRAHGIDVVAGACPMMFLEPVGWFHRLHRRLAA